MRHILSRQPLQLHDRGRPSSHQCAAEVKGFTRLIGANRGQTDDWLRPEVIGKILEHGIGLSVGPMKIFQDEQETVLTCQTAEKA